jgi:hypothetical protein
MLHRMIDVQSNACLYRALSQGAAAGVKGWLGRKSLNGQDLERGGSCGGHIEDLPKR